GTLVTLRLPAVAPPPMSAGTLGSVAPGRNVLLVEDEPTLRAVVDRLLSANGYTVAGFADAEAALAALEQPVGNGFDAVVTDLGLPGITGWQFLEALHDRFSALPVVVATGWAAQIDGRRLQRCGIPGEQIIGKPYRRDELLAALGHALGTGADSTHA
ncbi:MAG TPA: response regulator, partial [Chloroflexota bacterium]|nr:response regulator [Chloroflexota bacterium]